MNKLIIQLAIFIAFTLSFYLFGCQDNQKEKSTSRHSPILSSVDDTILLTTAQRDIANYSRWWGITPDKMKFNEEDSTISFTDVKISDPFAIEAFKKFHLSHEFAPFYDEQGPAWAHVIRIEELKKALGIDGVEIDYDGIRFYNGTNFPDSIDFRENPEEFLKHTQTKLYFVPVMKTENEYKDVIPGNIGHEYVYDLTMPCPQSCDSDSPLHQSIEY